MTKRSDPCFVPTPSNPYCRDIGTNAEVLTKLARELRQQKQWTGSCTSILLTKPDVLYQFDKNRVYLDTVFESPPDITLNILLNPLQCLCLERECLLDNPIVRLKELNHIDTYVDHLNHHLTIYGSDHCRFSKLMIDRLSTTKSTRCFTDPDKILSTSVAPASVLAEYDIVVPPETMTKIKQLSISRDYGDSNYLSWWMNVAFQRGVLKPSNLIFQMLDAFILASLYFPHPLPDWTQYRDLLMFNTALYAISTESIYRCFRGSPDVQLGKRVTHGTTVSTHMSKFNVISASLATLGKTLPPPIFVDVYNKSYVAVHLQMLRCNKNSVSIRGLNFEKYFVTIVADEQAISQTTFTLSEKSGQYLMGLQRPLTAGCISEMGGIEKLVEEIEQDRMKYKSAVLEFRLVDAAGILCSGAATHYLHDSPNQETFAERVIEVHKRISECARCIDEGTDCKYDDADQLQACSNCVVANVMCVSLHVGGVVVDMASPHKAASQHLKDENNIDIAFGIYHIVKALTNGTRNYTILLNDCFFSSQLLMSMYNMEASSLGRLPREVLIGRDRQSDCNSYMYISSATRNALAEEGAHLYQRYPDRHQVKKSAYQKPLLDVRQTVVNRNGECLLLQCDGKIGIVTHGVFCQLLELKLVLADTSEDPVLVPDKIDEVCLGFLYGRKSSGRVYNEYVAVINREEKSIYLYGPTPRTFTGSKSEKGSLRPDKRSLKRIHRIHLGIDTDVLMCKSFTSTRQDDVSSFTVVCTEASQFTTAVHCLDNEIIIRACCSKQTGVFAVDNRICVIPSTNIRDIKVAFPTTMLDCEYVLFVLTHTALYIVFPDGQITRRVALESELGTCTQCFVHVLSFISSRTDRQYFQSEVSLICVQEDGKLTSTKIQVSMHELEVLGTENLPPYCISVMGNTDCYGRTLIFAGLNEKRDIGLFFKTPTDEAVKFCKNLEDLYASVGFANTDTQVKPSHTIMVTPGQSVVLMDRAYLSIHKFMERRTRLFQGNRQSSSAIGFFCSDTIRCLKQTIAHVHRVDKLLRPTAAGVTVVNGTNIRTDCLINELYVEHFFGTNVQSATSNCQTLEEYAYKKRKLEVKCILQNCRTTFKFQAEQNKLYTNIRQCDVDAWDVLKLLKSQERNPIAEHSVPSSEAHKKFLDLAQVKTSGKRNLPVRSRWRKTAGTKPYSINK